MPHDTPAAAPSRCRPATCVLCRSVERERLFAKLGRDFVRCRGCSLVWVEPLPTPAELEAYYERTYRDGIYAPFAAAEEIRDAIARRRLARLAPYLPLGRWLDIGCGTGAFVAAAAAAGAQAEGIDRAPEAVARARARGLAVFAARGEDFSPAAPYVAATAFDVLEHTPDPRAFLDRARRWLSPGGVLALTVPNIESLSARLMGKHWFYYAPDDHLFYFTRATLARLLAETGFVPLLIEAALKPLTLDYALAQLGTLTPALARPARYLRGALPPGLRRRSVAVPVGELLAVARRS